MTVTYKGMTQDFEYRVAEVNYDDENKKEVELVERTIFLMEKVKGYKKAIIMFSNIGAKERMKESM